MELDASPRTQRSRRGRLKPIRHGKTNHCDAARMVPITVPYAHTFSARHRQQQAAPNGGLRFERCVIEEGVLDAVEEAAIKQVIA